MDTPFTIGDTYYLPHHPPTQVTVPCPTCYGAKKVTVILGNGEQVEIQCEGCGRGFDGPSGCITEYRYEPFVSTFTIASVHSMVNGEWTLKSTQGETARLTDLLTSPAEAVEQARLNAAECVDQNNRVAEARSAAQRGNLAWSIPYHEKCIKDNEQKIAWHRTKVSERRK